MEAGRDGKNMDRKIKHQEAWGRSAKRGVPRKEGEEEGEREEGRKAGRVGGREERRVNGTNKLFCELPRNSMNGPWRREGGGSAA